MSNDPYESNPYSSNDPYQSPPNPDPALGGVGPRTTPQALQLIWIVVGILAAMNLLWLMGAIGGVAIQLFTSKILTQQRAAIEKAAGDKPTAERLQIEVQFAQMEANQKHMGLTIFLSLLVGALGVAQIVAVVQAMGFRASGRSLLVSCAWCALVLVLAQLALQLFVAIDLSQAVDAAIRKVGEIPPGGPEAVLLPVFRASPWLSVGGSFCCLAIPAGFHIWTLTYLRKPEIVTMFDK